MNDRRFYSFFFGQVTEGVLLMEVGLLVLLFCFF